MHDTALPDGPDADSVFVVERGEVRVIRAEPWDADGEVLRVSNPICRVPPGYEGELPRGRQA